VSALAGTEKEQPYAMFWDFSRRVTEEDKFVLEQTNPDFPVGVTEEVHLRCDKVTLAYRRHLAGLAGQGAGGRAEPAA
jgi:Vanillate O-demethylase oxygenase C-terminal domain